MGKLTVIDMFCGAGGLSEGFGRAGFKIVAGIDNDREALETYAANHPKSVAICADLSRPHNFDSDGFKKLPRKVDVIMGGPPCQGVSVAGKRDGNDPRNNLYKACIAFIERFKPEAVVLENVPSITSVFDGKIASAILSNLGRLGFTTTVSILNSADYGVPQKRRRAFFVGLKKGRVFELPQPTTRDTPISAEAAIGDLPLLENEIESSEYASEPQNEYQRMIRRGAKRLFNHWAVQHTEKTKRIVSLVPDGGNYKCLPENLRGTRKVNIAWTRMNSREPCFTIDAGHNHHFHYKANRVPTVRECARIQSFPDRFIFYGKKMDQFRQVGNAVPPLMAKAVAEKLERGLN